MNGSGSFVVGLLVLASGAGPSILTAETRPAKEIPIPAYRIPEGGRFPQIAQSRDGLHVLYFKGERKGGDVYYAKISPLIERALDFSKAVRLNPKPGSVAVLDEADAPRFDVSDEQIHAVWKSADPQSPVLEYARATDGGKKVVVQTLSRDPEAGGASLTAGQNQVYVCWHAPDPKQPGERRLWLAYSYNDGTKFQSIETVSPAGVRVLEKSSTCALRLFTLTPNFAYWSESKQGGADLHDLSRSFIDRTKVHDELIHHARKRPGFGTSIDMAQTHQGYLMTWEADGQIYVAPFTRTARDFHQPGRSWSPAGVATDRRNPSICLNEPDTALVWTETSEDGTSPILRWQFSTNLKNEPSRRGVLPLASPDRRGVFLRHSTPPFVVIHD